MKRRLTKIGNSWGLILPKEILELLAVEPPEVDVEVVGSTLVVSAPDIAPEEIDASLGYLASKRERAEVYRRLA
jgi:antitoxin component of MazEF toxin-antitoxin module